MSKCTAAQAVNAFDYYMGYYEKAGSSYASTRDKSAFEKNKGAANYTYMGHLCGVQGQPWCAATVSTAIYDACGQNKTTAKEVMWGVWPYISCNQLYDAAPGNMKGRRGSWTPKPGDVIVFSDNGSTRTHTGMVYAVDGSYVYTMEGNSGNMCRKRSYLLNSTYVWGYVRPNYSAASPDDPAIPGSDQYGPVVYADIGLHELSKGCAGPEVKTIQRIIFARDINPNINADGAFGPDTKNGVIALQKQLGLTQDGCVGKDTWKAILTKL